jgi:hypothetical protein
VICILPSAQVCTIHRGQDSGLNTKSFLRNMSDLRYLIVVPHISMLLNMSNIRLLFQVPAAKWPVSFVLPYAEDYSRTVSISSIGLLQHH